MLTDGSQLAKLLAGRLNATLYLCDLPKCVILAYVAPGDARRLLLVNENISSEAVLRRLVGGWIN